VVKLKLLHQEERSKRERSRLLYFSILWPLGGRWSTVSSDRMTQATMVKLKLHIPQGSPSRRLGLARKLLVGDRSLWHATRLLSLTPNLREFQALTSVP